MTERRMVDACPNPACQSSQFRKSGRGFVCRECGNEFDDPIERRHRRVQGTLRVDWTPKTKIDAVWRSEVLD